MRMRESEKQSATITCFVGPEIDNAWRINIWRTNHWVGFRIPIFSGLTTTNCTHTCTCTTNADEKTKTGECTNERGSTHKTHAHAVSADRRCSGNHMPLCCMRMRMSYVRQCVHVSGNLTSRCRGCLRCLPLPRLGSLIPAKKREKNKRPITRARKAPPHTHASRVASGT